MPVTRIGDGDQRYVLSIADPAPVQALAGTHLGSGRISIAATGSAASRNITEQHPFQFGDRSLGYEPGEAEVKLKGGNSNWRGPVWFPTSYLLIHSFVRFDQALGANSRSALAGSQGSPITPTAMAGEAANRMISIFSRDANGQRACFGRYEKFQDDPHWRDCLLFNEYYHGDSGMGLGASHQTGWSGLVANLIDEWRR